MKLKMNINNKVSKLTSSSKLDQIKRLLIRTSSINNILTANPVSIAKFTKIVSKLAALIIFAAKIAASQQQTTGSNPQAETFLKEARAQIGVTVSYDPTYRKLKFPNGDVPSYTGVCTDVVIRAFRKMGVDLQKEVNQDMSSNFSKYPKSWNLKNPDTNIDHRRVPNLMKFFQRKGKEINITKDPKDYLQGDYLQGDYLPGDIVTWDLGGGVTHIGIVSDKKNASGVPLIVHNIGAGAQEEDILFEFKVIGHYRWF